MSTTQSEAVERLRAILPVPPSIEALQDALEAVGLLDPVVRAERAEAEVERLRAALRPFAQPRATSRSSAGAHPPEDDLMSVEVLARDWIRACCALGYMDAEYLRVLPPNARPSQAFIDAMAADHDEAGDAP